MGGCARKKKEGEKKGSTYQAISLNVCFDQFTIAVITIIYNYSNAKEVLGFGELSKNEQDLLVLVIHFFFSFSLSLFLNEPLA